MQNSETTSFKPWKGSHPPKKVLIIRFHAVGDVAITLPACSAFRAQFPHSRIDFLTGERSAYLPTALSIFDNVFVFKHCTNFIDRVIKTCFMGFSLSKNGYDVVLDLQRNWVSRIIRRIFFRAAYGEFDRYSPLPAAVRVFDVFKKTGFIHLPPPECKLSLQQDICLATESILRSNGWNGETPLICLNPAGLWQTRNWPLENYISMAREWLTNESVKFLILGDNRINEKAEQLKQNLQDSVINLVNKTTLAEAFCILQKVSVMISEDSGLMHMAWVSGIPTIALFGSSRHEWSTPVGEHTRCLHSGDLECGACMSPQCKYGDVHCLTRYTPQQVYRIAQEVRAFRQNNFAP